MTQALEMLRVSTSAEVLTCLHTFLNHYYLLENVGHCMTWHEQVQEIELLKKQSGVPLFLDAFATHRQPVAGFS